jgi:putative component of membrane protein insertase Oxa1/YidC/SpoIIIJ protein YidD
VKRKNNLIFLGFKVAQIISGLLFFVGCQSVYLQSPIQSSIDAQYRLKRIQNSAVSYPQSPSVGLYRRVIRPVLGSHCSYFPSDSEHAVILSKKCSAPVAALKSFARYSREFDAGTLGIPIIKNLDKSYYAETSDSCDF